MLPSCHCLYNHVFCSYKYSQEILVLVVCFTSFLCGIPHIYQVSDIKEILHTYPYNCSQGGIYTFHIVDYYSATISLMYIAFFETIAIVW